MSTLPNSDSTASPLSENGSAAALTVMEERIGVRELRRRLWHITPGFLPFLLWPIPHSDPVSTTLKSIIFGISLLVAGRIFLQFQEVQRGNSDSRIGAILGYLIAVLGTLLLFPAHAELAFLVLAILAFGDGTATLGGVLFGGPALPWNQGKTVVGTAMFILWGTLMGAVIYWGEANPMIPFVAAIQIAAITAVMAALAESLPVRLDDNIRVGVAAAVAAPLAHAAVIGF